MYYLLFYDVTEDFINRRAPFREEHLRLAKEAHQRGELVMAGALSEPADGAVLVFKTDDRTVVERFATNDPYVKEGAVTAWKFRPWNVVFGGEGAH